MNKVITINLNGNAYQLEEAGFALLEGYLKDAAHSLEHNPDKEEIMSDFEQGIADKCKTYLHSNKTVLSTKEIETIISQMGPVDGSTTEEKTSHTSEDTYTPPKRLYKIKEGAVLGGVCNGIALYFNIDVTFVRIIFIILGFITHGAMIIVYIIMAIIIPYAKTDEQKASARGKEYTNTPFMKKLREKYVKMEDKIGEKLNK